MFSALLSLVLVRSIFWPNLSFSEQNSKILRAKFYLVIVLNQSFSCSFISFSEKYFLAIFVLFRAKDAVLCPHDRLGCISVKNGSSSEIVLKLCKF